jgi:hypothetical protein
MTSYEGEFASPSDAPATETGFAQARIPGRLYASKTFPNGNYNSADYGQPSRFVYQVFDDDGTATTLRREGEEWIVTPAGATRSQIKVLVSREAGALVDVWIHRVPNTGSEAVVKEVLRLRRDDAIRLAEFFRRLMLLEPDGADSGVRLDDDVVAELLNRPEAASRLYAQQAPVFRALIEDDEHARDVIAVAGRRSALERFRRMLSDDSYFDSLVERGKGKEAVWQRFFEMNPWILGVGLGTQLYTSWSDEKLEQIVKGHSIEGDGKRADAVMRTSGLIQTMVFAEIKHHRTPLLKDEYRPSVWSLSKDLVGGISQAQVTVHQAVAGVGERIARRDDAGFETRDLTYLVRPRSYLVIGQLSQFTNDLGAHHPEKIRSFELARRNLQEPEVLTFDELLARAEWIVEGSR